MIKPFKLRAQAIFIIQFFGKDTPSWFAKFEFENFFPLFYIISTQRSYIHQKLDTNSCFAKLRANRICSVFFYTLCIIKAVLRKYKQQLRLVNQRSFMAKSDYKFRNRIK
jgi:hypothetical protein